MPLNYLDAPICPRNDKPIEDRFSMSCPLQFHDPLDVVRETRDHGFIALDHHRWTEAGKFLDKAQVCHACIASGILFTRNVKRIREAFGYVNCD